MIETSSIQTNAATTVAPATASAPSQPSGLTSDFETFLKMLTAQARYQDPLEPIDSTEYAAQLAQFSMVEQQVQTNNTLTALFGQSGTSNMASLASWVGMQARAETPVYFDGHPIKISSNPAKTADQAFLVVTSERGEEIQRLPIAVSPDTFQWAGVDGTGAPFPAGVYEFKVESFSNGEPITSGPTETYSRIIEAQIKDNEVLLIMEGGQAIPANSVTALSEGI